MFFFVDIREELLLFFGELSGGEVEGPIAVSIGGPQSWSMPGTDVILEDGSRLSGCCPHDSADELDVCVDGCYGSAEDGMLSPGGVPAFGEDSV